MPETVMEPLSKTLFSGYIGEGPRVKEFEEKFGRWIGNENTLMVNSGTSALHLAVHLSIKSPESEVITTPMTCLATNAPIIRSGGKVVWADIDRKTGLIDPKSIEKKITKNTCAIVMVHWGGNPCQIDEINAIAKKYGIRTIEDAAHAIGTEYKGRHLGNNTSDFVVHSFQAIKHINTVDGGVLISRNGEDHERGKLLRWYGIDREIRQEDLRCESDVSEVGYKFHMNDVAATIGIEMMNYVDGIVAKHQANAKYYDENIKSEYLIPDNPDGKSAHWLYTINLPLEKRDEFIRYMIKNDVMASKVHARNDLHSAFRKSKVNLPGVDHFYSTMCSIPVGWWLSEDDRGKIIDLVNNFSI